MMKERVFLLPAFCMAAGALRETRCALCSCTHGSTCYFLYFIAKCIVLILKYRRKNIIVQLQNAKVSTTKIMLLFASMPGLLMAGREGLVTLTQSQTLMRRNRRVQHTPVATSHGNVQSITIHHPPHPLFLPSPIPFFLPPPCSPCPLTVKGVGQHEHSTPTVVVCCVHCTTRGSHTPGVPQCVHTQPPPTPTPRCRAGPRSKDQVLFLKSLHFGSGLARPMSGVTGWVGAGHHGQS